MAKDKTKEVKRQGVQEWKPKGADGKELDVAKLGSWALNIPAEAPKPTYTATVQRYDIREGKKVVEDVEVEVPTVRRLNTKRVGNEKFAPGTPDKVRNERGMGLYIEQNVEDIRVSDVATWFQGITATVDGQPRQWSATQATAQALLLDNTRYQLGKAQKAGIALQSEYAVVSGEYNAAKEEREALEQKLNALTPESISKAIEEARVESAGIDVLVRTRYPEERRDLLQIVEDKNLPDNSVEKQNANTRLEQLRQEETRKRERMAELNASIPILISKLGQVRKAVALETEVARLEQLKVEQTGVKEQKKKEFDAFEAKKREVRNKIKVLEDVEIKAAETEMNKLWKKLYPDEQTLAKSGIKAQGIVEPGMVSVGGIDIVGSGMRYSEVKKYLAVKESLDEKKAEAERLKLRLQNEFRSEGSTLRAALQTATDALKETSALLDGKVKEFATATKGTSGEELVNARITLRAVKAKEEALALRLAGLQTRAEALAQKVGVLTRQEVVDQAATALTSSFEIDAMITKLKRPTEIEEVQEAPVSNHPWLRKITPQFILDWIDRQKLAKAAKELESQEGEVESASEVSKPETEKVGAAWFEKLNRYLTDSPEALDKLPELSGENGKVLWGAYENASEVMQAVKDKKMSFDNSMKLYRYLMLEFKSRNTDIDELPSDTEINAVDSFDSAVHVGRLVTVAVARHLGVDSIFADPDPNKYKAEKEAIKYYTGISEGEISPNLMTEELWERIYEKTYAKAMSEGKQRLIPPAAVGGPSGLSEESAPAQPEQQAAEVGAEQLVPPAPSGEEVSLGA